MAVRANAFVLAGVAATLFAGTPYHSSQALAAETDSDLGAKALFYNASGVTTQVSSAAPAAAQPLQPPNGKSGTARLAGTKPKLPVTPLALRAAVLLAADSGGTREVKPSYTFRTDDRIKLSFTANKTGYFYLATIGSTGRVQILAPRANEPAILEAGNRYTFPAKSHAYFRFDSKKGKEELWAILSDTPLDSINMGGGQIAQLSPSAPSSTNPSNVVLAEKSIAEVDVGDTLASKDLVFEEDANALFASVKPSAYTQGGSSKASVVVKLILTHE